MPRLRPRLSDVLLVLANLVPVAGVLLLGWSLGSVLLLYWAESGVVGLFNVARMVRVDARGSLLAVPAFLVHYGAFMAGHLLFLSLLLAGGMERMDLLPDVEALRALVGPGWAAAGLALAASHGVSFFTEFLGGREWEGRTLHQQMMAPYGRIVVMHLVILFGAVPVFLLGSPWPLVLLLVLLKTAADLRGHRREHVARGRVVGQPA